ncbi:hypothetical protein EPUL_005617, partial [Erysiphe pulchra]
APTKEQLKIYRQAGDREFQAAARVRAAEEKASEMEANKQNMRGTGDKDASSERGETVVVTIPESPEPDEVRVNIPENVQQELGRELQPHLLKFMSINVGRGGATHDIALARACELQLDVLLVQEPWWSGRTKSHPYFDRHIPYAVANTRPRAITYTRKDTAKIDATQQYSSNQLTTPHNPAAVQPLLDWTPPQQSVAIGDFNSVHWAWQPSAITSCGHGEEIERWAEDHNLSCLIIGEPTHRAGNTLDLVWTNISGASAWVGREECVTSDHFPICGIVPSRNQPPIRSKGHPRVTKDKLSQFSHVVSCWLPPMTSLNSPADAESLAQALCRVLTEAIQA